MFKTIYSLVIFQVLSRSSKKTENLFYLSNYKFHFSSKHILLDFDALNLLKKKLSLFINMFF